MLGEPSDPRSGRSEHFYAPDRSASSSFAWKIHEDEEPEGQWPALMANG
jgi:hypothetical protein